MKNRKLTDEEKEAANRYAAEKWAEECVTADDQTNSDGEIVFRRVKITTKPAGKVLAALKKKGKSVETGPKGRGI